MIYLSLIYPQLFNQKKIWGSWFGTFLEDSRQSEKLKIKPALDWLCYIFRNTYTRVANVVADHDDLLTQWRPIKMSKFCTKIFLIQTTSNYFWASEVFKNQRFKSHSFSFSQYKKYPKLKTWVNFYAIIILY